MSQTGDSQLKQRYEALAVVLSRLMQPSLGDEQANSLLLAQMKVQLGLALISAYHSSGAEKVLQVFLSKEASLPWIVEKLQEELVPVAEEFYLTLTFAKAPRCRMRLTEGNKVKFDAGYRPASLTLTAKPMKVPFVLAFLEMLVDLLEEELHEAPADILSVPHLPHDSADWGKVVMKEKVGEVPAGNIYAATGLTDGGEVAYLEALKRVFS